MVKSNQETAGEVYAPVAFDPAVFITQRSGLDPAFKSAYAALQDEFSTLDALMSARKAAGLTQAEVASRMGINPASLARIEGSLGSRKHSPSLATLRKYAQACGMHLTISLG